MTEREIAQAVVDGNRRKLLKTRVARSVYLHSQGSCSLTFLTGLRVEVDRLLRKW